VHSTGPDGAGGARERLPDDLPRLGRRRASNEAFVRFGLAEVASLQVPALIASVPS